MPATLFDCRLGVLVAIVWGLLACEAEVVQNQPITVKPPSGQGQKSRRGGAEGAGGKNAGETSRPPKVEYQEEDFVESARSRDPFRSFAELFVEQSDQTPGARREVVLEDFSIDELKLIGIVTRIRPAKAMLLDPTGQGHVVHRNDYVGRAERVQVGGMDAEYELNWRVDRIRAGDIVLIREDPANPDVPSATRVISLRPEDAKIQ